MKIWKMEKLSWIVVGRMDRAEIQIYCSIYYTILSIYSKKSVVHPFPLSEGEKWNFQKFGSGKDWFLKKTAGETMRGRER